MIQLYEKNPGDELVPVSESLVTVLTGDEVVVVYKSAANPADEDPIAINFIRVGDRGFGDWDARKFYEIDAEGRRIFEGDFPFRHLDKTTSSTRYFVEPDVSIDDFILEFQGAGYEILQRRKSWTD